VLLTNIKVFVLRDPSSRRTPLTFIWICCYPFKGHSPHPYLHISLHRPISPVQHRALHPKKTILLPCTSCSGRAYVILHARSYPLYIVCARLLACVAVNTLACLLLTYHRLATSLPLLVISLFVYFLSFQSLFSGLAPLVCLFLIRSRQWEVRSAGPAIHVRVSSEYRVKSRKSCDLLHSCRVG
jgi:hypothetical protein